MNSLFAVTAAIVLLGMGLAAQAIDIETVYVADSGNAPDTRVMNDGTTGYGSVGYKYNIGKYEVTAGQYTAFLNAVAATDTYGLYNTYMDTVNDPYGCNIKRSGSSGSYTYSVASDWANRPVNFVGYWDSCRFANWLGNGQPTGLQNALTTEDGAYTLNGYNGTDGRAIQRNAGWNWAVTSEDEWYKAAYYKGGSTSAGYWLYPTSSDTAPGRDMADASGNNANYYSNSLLIGSPYYRTEVGEFQNSESPYGTFDQSGNVSEWNEAILSIDGDYTFRLTRGGSFTHQVIYLQASRRYTFWPPEASIVGFRVSAVPEPSSLIALAGGLVGLLGIRRRRA